MVNIKGTIPDDLDDRFRREIAKRYGMKRGAISAALEEAIRQWLGDHPSDEPTTDKQSYNILKKRLIKEYPGKICILKEGEVVAIEESIKEVTEKARQKYPSCNRFTLIDAVTKKQRKAQLGWKVRRLSK